MTRQDLIDGLHCAIDVLDETSKRCSLDASTKCYLNTAKKNINLVIIKLENQELQALTRKRVLAKRRVPPSLRN